VAIDTNTLTTLAVLKTWLGVTDAASDIQLQWSINQASRIVQTYCARNFTQQRYYEIRDTTGQVKVRLNHYPVSIVRFVGIGWDSAIAVNSTLSTDIFASVSVDAEHVHLHRVASNGAESSHQENFASHDSTSELATAISARTGFSGALLLNLPSVYLRKTAGADLKNRTVYLEAPTEGIDVDNIDLDTGILYGKTLNLDRSILVDYTAGYADIPSDVELATLTIASRCYRNRTRDRGVASESLGGYSYTLRGMAEIEDEEKKMLAPYRRLR
jgi:hypothetical protein